MPFSLFLALKYLKPERSFVSVVTAISIAGVTLGVAILVIVMSVMNGFGNMWREKILSFKPHFMIMATSGMIVNEEQLCRKIETVPGVIGAAPSIETKVMLQYRGVPATPTLIGIDPLRARHVSKITNSMEIGKFDVSGNRIVIGIDLASQLNVSLGSKILVNGPMNIMSRDELYLPTELIVSGIFNMGMRDYDSGFVITSLDVARELVGADRGSYSIFVVAQNPDDYKKQETIAGGIRRELGAGFVVRNWREVDSMLFNALQYEKAMMFVLLAFIFIVAIFCVTNTIIVVIVQKTNEIGLLKALGFTSWRVMSVFIWHGLIQCFLGTTTGIGAGLLVSYNIPFLVSMLSKIRVEVFPKAIYGLDGIPCEVAGQDLLVIIGAVVVCCVLASLLAAWKAAVLKPAEALRQE
ncbi:MAG: hypothetical protein C0404_12720 [Verrucomicrobia bacterium]|nr:hypothetical protein [Verrucomicrobiota bacterium]